MTTEILIERNERDLCRLHENVRVLRATNGPPTYIGESERIIREILKCNSIMRGSS
jgi:hypothetical protein